MAGNHFTTKFVTFDAEKAPFLVTKLQIKVLPTILCFMDGVVKDVRVILSDGKQKVAWPHASSPSPKLLPPPPRFFLRPPGNGRLSG